VVIKRWNREFAFGGHDTPGVSGVYATQPQQEPPGGTFRRGLVQGVTFRTDDELGLVLDEAAQRFQGTRYNLLNCNCNHFTSFLCAKLTNKAPPGWLNRAASIALTLPCVVPRDWLTLPDYASVNGELLIEEEEDRRAMLWDESSQPYFDHGQLSSEQNDRRLGEHCRRCGMHDNDSCCAQGNSGRTLPTSE
jgi:deubiquitinase DESI2